MQAAEEDPPPSDESFVFGPGPGDADVGADTLSSPGVADLWQDMMARWIAPAEPDPSLAPLPVPPQDDVWG